MFKQFPVTNPQSTIFSSFITEQKLRNIQGRGPLPRKECHWKKSTKQPCHGVKKERPNPNKLKKWKENATQISAKKEIPYDKNAWFTPTPPGWLINEDISVFYSIFFFKFKSSSLHCALVSSDNVENSTLYENTFLCTRVLYGVEIMSYVGEGGMRAGAGGCGPTVGRFWVEGTMNDKFRKWDGAWKWSSWIWRRLNLKSCGEAAVSNFLLALEDLIGLRSTKSS